MFSVLFANKSEQFNVPIRCNSFPVLGSFNKTCEFLKDENLSYVVNPGNLLALGCRMTSDILNEIFLIIIILIN